MRHVALALVLAVCGHDAVAQPSAIPIDAHAACRQRRAEMMREAQRRTTAAERQAILVSLPDCSRLAPPPITPPALVAPIRDTTHSRSGVTVDIAGGLGIGLSPRNAPVSGLAGPNLGVGAFVTERIVLGARVTGLFVTEHDNVFAGVVGAGAQLWFTERSWTSIAVGKAFVLGCAGCDAPEGVDVDLRAGYSFGAAGHGVFAAVGCMTYDERKIFNVQVGYQTF